MERIPNRSESSSGEEQLVRCSACVCSGVQLRIVVHDKEAQVISLSSFLLVFLEEFGVCERTDKNTLANAKMNDADVISSSGWHSMPEQRGLWQHKPSETLKNLLNIQKMTEIDTEIEQSLRCKGLRQQRHHCWGHDPPAWFMLLQKLPFVVQF